MRIFVRANDSTKSYILKYFINTNTIIKIMKKSELAYAITQIDVYNTCGICWTSCTKQELVEELNRLKNLHNENNSTI